MGEIAEVLDSERTLAAGVHGTDVKVDAGGGALVTAAHFAASGDDAPPLPGDYAALEDSTGAGAAQVSGYVDVRNAGESEPGEKRIYARNALGIIVAELWLKGDGSVLVTPLGGALVTIAGGAEFVALSTKVLTELQAVKTAFDAHTHLYNPGPSAPAPTAPPAAPMPAPASVASVVLKSD